MDALTRIVYTSMKLNVIDMKVLAHLETVSIHT